jgi:predicted acyltransferase
MHFGTQRGLSVPPPNRHPTSVIQAFASAPGSSTPQRLQSIDILRGATIALMILVNDPGDPHCVYPQLQHAEWNGYTAADLVFPNFLFLSGASLVFSLQSRVERSRKQGRSLAPIAASLARRSLNLLALKLLVAAFPAFRLRRIRIFGVLFRTALLSLLGGLTLLATFSIPILLGVVSALLGGYWLALRLPFRLPNGEALNHPLLDPDNNLAAWLDRKIAHLFHGQLHTGALYNVTHDPEGLLSSAAALATVLIGSVAALVLRHKVLNPIHKRNLLAAAGLASLAAGHLWSRKFPINKNLWTSSYVLASAGWSLLALATLYTAYDLPASKPLEDLDSARYSLLPSAHSLSLPFQIFGANALPVYILSILGHKLARTLHLHHDGHHLSYRTFTYRKIFAPDRSTPLRSLAFGVTYAALCFLPNLALWRRKIFLKV